LSAAVVRYGCGTKRMTDDRRWMADPELTIMECKAVRAGSLRGTRKTAANGISRVSGMSGNHPNL